MKSTQIITEITVVPENKPIFDENGYTVHIYNDGAGEYVTVTENLSGNKIKIDEESWSELKMTIDGMIKTCETLNREV